MKKSLILWLTMMLLLSGCGGQREVGALISRQADAVSEPPASAEETIAVQVVPWEDVDLVVENPSDWGDAEELALLTVLLSEFKSTVSHIVIATRDVDKEHTLPPEWAELLIARLQAAEIKTYGQPNNPPTGGNYYDLLAYDPEGGLYLHLAYNGEWLVAGYQENAPKIFDGRDKKFEEIRSMLLLLNLPIGQGAICC